MTDQGYAAIVQEQVGPGQMEQLVNTGCAASAAHIVEALHHFFPHVSADVVVQDQADPFAESFAVSCEQDQALPGKLIGIF